MPHTNKYSQTISKMIYNSAKMQERDSQLAVCAANPVFTALGNVDVAGTLFKYGMPGKSFNLRRRLQALLPPDAIKSPQKEDKLMYTGWKGLRICEKDLKSHTSAELKNPAIFQIVHLKSGRKYITGSIIPHLQRSVLFYWMKNWFTYSNANSFFGNIRFIKDFIEDGPNGFEYQIIQTFEFIEQIELERMVRDLVLKYNQEDVYNRLELYQNKKRAQTDVFYHINKEMKALVDDLEKYYEKESLIEGPNKARRLEIEEERKTLYRKRTNIRRAIPIDTQLKILSEEKKELIEELKTLKAKIKLKEARHRTLHKKLCLDYAIQTKPFKIKGL